MRSTATDGIVWSVCLQKQLNQSKCGHGAVSCGPKEPCTRWGRHPPQEQAILGIVQPTEKHCESAVVYAAKGTIQSSITTSSTLNNSTTPNATFRQNSLTTC